MTGVQTCALPICGGQGLGTALMIESDSFSNYGEYLLSYGMAQALSSGHKVLVLTDNPLSAEVVASTLPYNQNVGTSKVAVITAKSASGGEISVETEESTPKKEISDKIDAGNENSGLKIAWQYEKYVTKGNYWISDDRFFLFFSCAVYYILFSFSIIVKIQSTTNRESSLQLISGREKEVEKVLLAGEYSTQYCCAFDLSRR